MPPSAMSSVEDVWAQLKQQQLPQRRGGASLSGLASIPGVTTRVVRTSDSRSRGRQKGEPPSYFASLGAGSRPSSAAGQGQPAQHEQLQDGLVGCAAQAPPAPCTCMTLMMFDRRR